MQLPRRTLLACLAALPTLTHPAGARAEYDGGAGAGATDLDVREVSLVGLGGGARVFGDAFVLATPKNLAAGEQVPLVVLLHGLGETIDVRLGVRAWVDRYGLATAYARVRKGAPFRELAFACPYVPNVNKPNGARGETTATLLDAYARFLVDVVVPRARAEACVALEPARTALDGCSLGGFVGLEVFLRRPEAFGVWGGVQTAISEIASHAYAERIVRALAKVGPRAIHLETSTRDPFQKANAALAAALRSRGVPHDFACPPGPHDQPWLRETGTPMMLSWLAAHLP